VILVRWSNQQDAHLSQRELPCSCATNGYATHCNGTVRFISTPCLKKTSHLWRATTWHARSDYDNFWRKCYRESKKFDLTYLVLQHYLAKEETQKTAHWCIVCATQSNCCSTLDFLPEPCPSRLNSPKLNALITRFMESYSSMSMSRQSKRWNKSTSDWLNSIECTNAAFDWKRSFRVFPFCQVCRSTIIWGGIVKRLLIAYFIASIIYAKKYQNPFTCVKVIASQRWDVFWNTVYNPM